MSDHGHGDDNNVSQTKAKTPEVKEGGSYKVWIYIILVLIILIALTILNNRPKKIEPEKVKMEQPGQLPDSYTKYYTLKKGADPIRIAVPFGYDYTCSGGGKSYYHQIINGEKEIWGGGRSYRHTSDTDVPSFSLSYYDEEITVVVNFKKK